MKIAMKTLTVLGLVGATTLAIAATTMTTAEPVQNAQQQSVSQVQTTNQDQSKTQVTVNQSAVAPVNTSAGQVVNQNAIAPAWVTVKQALNLQDDSRVVLKGNIVKSLGNEKYIFQDKSGSMTVEIDDELWNGRAISPNTLVTIDGEVDIDYKPMKRIEIDVDYVSF